MAENGPQIRNWMGHETPEHVLERYVSNNELEKTSFLYLFRWLVDKFGRPSSFHSNNTPASFARPKSLRCKSPVTPSLLVFPHRTTLYLHGLSGKGSLCFQRLNQTLETLKIERRMIILDSPVEENVITSIDTSVHLPASLVKSSVSSISWCLNLSPSHFVLAVKFYLNHFLWHFALEPFQCVLLLVSIVYFTSPCFNISPAISKSSELCFCNPIDISTRFCLGQCFLCLLPRCSMYC